MRFLPGSLTPQIIEMRRDQQMGAVEIARKLGCTRGNVYKALRRHGLKVEALRAAPMMRIAPISHEERLWLRREARRMNVSWRDLARALLTDAIAEARDAERR